MASLLDSNDHKKRNRKRNLERPASSTATTPWSPSLLAYCTPLQSLLQHSRIVKSRHHSTSQAQSNDHPSQRGLRYTTYTRLHYCLCDHGYQSCQIADPPPSPGSRLVWSHLARRRLLPLPRRIRRFYCDLLPLRPFFLSTLTLIFSPLSTDVMGCESTSCPGRRGYTLMVPTTYLPSTVHTAWLHPMNASRNTPSSCAPAALRP